MSHIDDKELEVRLQFLDEAQEYLSAIEDALLRLSDRQVDIQKINAALRAAHSIKGGAAMMGFQTLSDLAHRIEDSFKILKVRRDSIEVDAELEKLLLIGVDCLHEVISYNRRDSAINQQWLEKRVYPIFERLHESLGDLPEEDASSVLSPEDGQDVVAMLFETEVEGCLQRLETALETSDPCLREELEILAQELGGLGEMLELSRFVQLCQSVERQLQANPDRLQEIASLALHCWRRSQALILTGHVADLPIALEEPGSEPHSVKTPVVVEEAIANITEPLIPNVVQGDRLVEELSAEELSDDLDLDDLIADADFTLDDTTALNLLLADSVEAFEVPLATTVVEHSDQDIAQSTSSDVLNLNASQRTGKDFQVRSGDIELASSERYPSTQPDSKRAKKASKESKVTDFRVLEEPASAASASPSENTVRVPLKQLDQLNDLFGELTIERNRLALEVKRLRNQISALTHRSQVLDEANMKLRTSYDKVAIQTRTNPQYSTPADSRGSSLISFNSSNGYGRSNYSNSTSADLSKFDALEMDRYGDLHSVFQEVMETIVQIQELTGDITLGLEDTEQTTRDLNKTARQMQTSLTQLRMRPLSDVTDRFPRALRELALEYNKPVQLKVYGNSTLVDRNILEALNDPLMHILRNAFDHGIEDANARQMHGKPEEGLIEIRAFHRSNKTVITISDDGGGIPLDKIRARALQMGLDQALLATASEDELLSLIFEPGFSTADRVTHLSGRGIGMDVVRNNLKQIQGEIKVNTRAGIGTTFTISVPFTLSVTRVLLAESHGLLLAFPTDVIEEMFLFEPEQIIATIGGEALDWDGTMVQLIRLSQWLQFNSPRSLEGLETPPNIDSPTILMLKHNNQLVGLQIDRSWGEQEVAIRRVEGGLPMSPGFTNCTILGDGRVVPLVNVPELLHWISSCDRTTSSPAPVSDISFGSPIPSVNSLLLPRLNVPAPPQLPAAIAQPSTILIVDDSINVRRLLALSLEKAGYRVAQAKDGQDALDKLGGGLHVQAVICDIEMPRLDGYGFLAKVKAQPEHQQLPVLMLTSRSGNKHRQLAISLGAAGYFSKPYDERQLFQTLKELIQLAPVGLQGR